MHSLEFAGRQFQRVCHLKVRRPLLLHFSNVREAIWSLPPSYFHLAGRFRN